MTMASGEGRTAMGEMQAVNRGDVNLVPGTLLLIPPFVRHVEIHDEFPSTNDRAMQLTLFAALETPALIVARRQLAGRGRGGHSWWSSDGALTFSLVLEPAAWDIAVAQWPGLSLTAAVAVCDAFEAGCKELEAESKNASAARGSMVSAPCSI
jgi:hypothetical protein